MLLPISTSLIGLTLTTACPGMQDSNIICDIFYHLQRIFKCTHPTAGTTKAAKHIVGIVAACFAPSSPLTTLCAILRMGEPCRTTYQMAVTWSLSVTNLKGKLTIIFTPEN